MTSKPPVKHRNEVPIEDLAIREKIKQAYKLHRIWKHALLGNACIQELLQKMASSVSKSRELMLAGGVVKACKWCEEVEGGSCCGNGIENRYTSLLLLINILLDVVFPEVRYAKDSCYFLGVQGCELKVRHVLCVNYLCKRLQRDLDPNVLEALQYCYGIELHTGFILCETIRKIIGF